MQHLTFVKFFFLSDTPQSSLFNSTCRLLILLLYIDSEYKNLGLLFMIINIYLQMFHFE